jgi:hypothetical protein
VLSHSNSTHDAKFTSWQHDGPRSLGFPIGSTTRHGLGPAHGLLEDMEKGGMISKL